MRTWYVAHIKDEPRDYHLAGFAENVALQGNYSWMYRQLESFRKRFDTFLLMSEDGSGVVHFVRCLSYVLHCQVSRPTNFSFRMKMLSPTYINSFLLLYFQALVFESSAYASVVLKRKKHSRSHTWNKRTLHI